MASRYHIFLRYALCMNHTEVGKSGTDFVRVTEMSKQGELEPLKFPSFRRELLYQNHWSPGDDIGRIKIIISEGFPRDSPSNPIERVKNVVAFSFQHAPLSEWTASSTRTSNGLG